MTLTQAPGIDVGTHIARLVPYTPGKPIDDVKRELGLTSVIKLASNENSLGPSPLAVQAMIRAMQGAHLYPDGACTLLREALAAFHKVPHDHFVFGNGSDEIIQYLGLTFVEPGDEVIQADPSFLRYEAAAILNRAACIKVPLTHWTHDLDAIADSITPLTRLIFIANPNNPTGTIVGANEVRRFIRRVPDRVVVVFDEAYYEYVDCDDFPDCVGTVREGRNVVVLRTFSKAYGLAGVRVGYGITTPAIAGFVNRVREPFNVSVLAQAAGVAALQDTEHLQRTIEMTLTGRGSLGRALSAMGLDVAPSEANFLWVDLRRPAMPVFEALLRRGIIVRAFDADGLRNHIRITIGTIHENEMMATALKEVLAL